MFSYLETGPLHLFQGRRSRLLLRLLVPRFIREVCARVTLFYVLLFLGLGCMLFKDR